MIFLKTESTLFQLSREFFNRKPMTNCLPPELFKNLESDISKFRRYGAPRFRINIPCKYQKDCKYGKYSCEYSHEPFCRFSKQGLTCLNSNCAYLHGLPTEYQLAQEVLMLKKQISRDPDSFETPILVAEHHFSSHSTSNNGARKPSISLQGERFSCQISRNEPKN